MSPPLCFHSGSMNRRPGLERAYFNCNPRTSFAHSENHFQAIPYAPISPANLSSSLTSSVNKSWSDWEWLGNEGSRIASDNIETNFPNDERESISARGPSSQTEKFVPSKCDDRGKLKNQHKNQLDGHRQHGSEKQKWSLHEHEKFIRREKKINAANGCGYIDDVRSINIWW